MLDSDWCMVGSRSAVMTLDVGVEQHIKLVGFTTSRNMILDMVFLLMVNSDYE